MSILDAPSLRDIASHLVEYPAGSGRMYHRHEDGSVLRLEARLGGAWHDLTCDVVEVSIQWGDVNGDDLTPYSDSGQAQIILKDLDGRYGPLPPTGFPLFTRWVPVRVWTGYVSDPDSMPVDLSTRYGTPGSYGSTPPATYGGNARTVHADGISCRFSGWLMAMERTPESEPITTWSCGDGMVRLVDQTVLDYDLSRPPGAPVTNDDWPTGLRENAPGNYRVQQLVSFIHGPTGLPYTVVSHASPTKRMMQSPGGKVSDLVHQTAESDLAFFWWQPDVTAADHDTPADWYGYRTFDWLSTHGLTWPIQCDGVHGFDGTLVSDDRNFYSAVRAAKGITERTVWTPQPPWSGFAFDSSVAKLIGGASFAVQPGERYTFRSQMDLNCERASVEYWFRITGTELVKLGENGLHRATEGGPTVVTGGSSTVEIAPDVPPGTVIEMQIRGRSLSPIVAPGHLADNVWFIVSRSGGSGPIVLVDDPTLADEAEIHEYERKDLILREQADVEAWAAWVVNRSKTARWMMESVSANPDQGDTNWSWGMWHSAWLGDRVELEIPDGGELHAETQWIRGMEFRIAETLTMTLHMETVPAGVRRSDLRVTVTGEAAGPSIPVPGGRIIPRYEARPEIPGWTQNQAGLGLHIDSTGELVWAEGDVGVRYPIRTRDPSAPRVEIDRTTTLDEDYNYGGNIRFYGGGPSHPWEGHRDGPDWFEVRLGYQGNNGVEFMPLSFTEMRTITREYLQEYFAQHFFAWDTWWIEHDMDIPEVNGCYPDTPDRYSSDFFMQWLDGGIDIAFGGAWNMMQSLGPVDGRTEADVYTWVGGAETDAEEFITAAITARHSGDPTPEDVRGFELRVTPDMIQVGTAPRDDALIHYAPYPLTARGTLPVLIGADVDPTTAQWYRQTGTDAVAFSAGVGSVTVPIAMGATRVPHAVVVGSTVGGPAIAQVNSTATTLTFALSTAHTGSLTIAWSVEHIGATFPAVTKAAAPRAAPPVNDRVNRRPSRRGHATRRTS